jgi:dihydroorotase
MIFFSRRVWNRQRGQFMPATFEIQRGRFSKIEWAAPQGTVAKKKIKDFGDLILGPSAVDLHIHSRDFRESHKETFETLEAQMLKGGVSAGACMANTQPRLDDVKTIDEFLKRVSKRLVTLKPFAAVSKNLEGREPTDWDALLKRPIVGLSDDGKPILDSEMMKAAMKATKKARKFISLHEEDTCISKASLLHESHVAIRSGIEGSSSESEVAMVKRDLDLLREIKGHLHFGHMSASGSVRVLKAARREGLSVSAELTPHHGILSVEDSEGFDWSQKTFFKVCPVIRSTEDRAALWQGLRDGAIDCFASDHAPHSRLEKDTTYTLAAHGMISMEFYWTLYNEVRLRADLSWKKFFDCLSYRPAELLGVPVGFEVGQSADFVVFDPEETTALHFQLSKSRNSPFLGKTMRGALKVHYKGGHSVYEA